MLYIYRDTEANDCFSMHITQNGQVLHTRQVTGNKQTSNKRAKRFCFFLFKKNFSELPENSLMSNCAAFLVLVKFCSFVYDLNIFFSESGSHVCFDKTVNSLQLFTEVEVNNGGHLPRFT